MTTTVIFVHLTYISIITWNSDRIDDARDISSRKSVRKDVSVYFNTFSERYTVDTGYGMFETDAVAITDRWVYELADVVIIPEFKVIVHGPATEIRLDTDTRRLALYRLNIKERELMEKMHGKIVPFRPSRCCH